MIQTKTIFCVGSTFGQLYSFLNKTTHSLDRWSIIIVLGIMPMLYSVCMLWLSYQSCPQWPCASYHPACGQFPPEIVLPAVALSFFPGPRAPQPRQTLTRAAQPLPAPLPTGCPDLCVLSLGPHLFLSPWHSMSAVNMWKSKSEGSLTSDVGRVCSSSYPVCQTCKKYGKTDHLNDTEKQRGAHNNPGFVNDEKKDPRDKLWWQSNKYWVNGKRSI